MIRSAEVSIDRALDYLHESQLPSGQFPMEVTIRDPVSGEARTASEMSPFCTSYIASSLGGLSDVRSTKMIAAALEFFEREKVRGGLWRYWCKAAPLHQQVPADVDDTACISEVLARLGNGGPNNESLLLANRSRDGLFYTWMVPRRDARIDLRWWWTILGDMNRGRAFDFWHGGAARDDVDGVVNANVLLYLGERKGTERVIAWLEEQSRERREASSDKWYRSTAAFYYALSRCFERGIESFASVKARMVEAFDDMVAPGGQVGGDPLQTALALCAIVNFGLPADRYEKSFAYLIEAQHDDGGWGSFPFYHDGRPAPLMSFASRAVTTGFCIEALSHVAAS